MLGVASAAVAQDRWSLDKCIGHAIENNISVRQSQLSIKQNELNLDQSKMDFLPSVDANVGQGWGFGRGLSADNTYIDRNTTSTSFNVSASLTIFQGLQRYNSVKRNQLNLEAAVADLQRVKENISISVMQNYLQVLYADELRAVSTRQVQLSRDLLHQREMYEQVGRATLSDVAETRAALARDELSLVEANNNYDIALLNLSQLLELDTPQGFAVEQPDTTTQLIALPSIEEVYADALQNKAIIKADEARIAAAEKNVSIARGAHSPTLSMGAGIGSNYYTASGYPHDSFSDQMDHNLSKSINLSLHIPIFSRFQTRNNIRSSRFQVEQQNLQLDSDKKELYKEVQQAYYNAVAAESKYGSSIKSEESALASFQLISKKFDNGKANQTEYNQSRDNWLRAESDRIQAKYEYIFRAKILDFYRGVSAD